ncbi:MAG: HEAT repeat domain-containing protein [Fimbriimonadaceae bacterium]|nr:HEAT repeat domain-containing protein [Fimbriimonadaceae bacterium]
MKFACAWLALSAVVSASAQTAGNVLGQVDVGGHQVPLVAPTTAGIYESSKTVALPDGRKTAWLSPSSLSEPYRVAGGWSELSAWPTLNLAAARKLHIKVVLATSALCLYEGAQVRAERVGFTSRELAEIDGGLAQLKALLEVAGNGTVQVEYSVTTDPSTTIQVERGGKITDLDDLTNSTGLGPVMNRSPFATDDGSYWGPYACSIVIHPGLGEVGTLVHGSRPCGVVPYRATTGGRYLPFGAALLVSLGGTPDGRVQGILRGAVEQPETAPYLATASGGVTETTFDGQPALAVAPSLVAWVQGQTGQSAKPVTTKGQTVFLYDPAKPKGLAAQLGLPDPGQVSAPAGSAGTPAGAGELKVESLDDAEGKRYRIDLPKAAYNRAMATLPVEGQGASLEPGSSLTFRFRSRSREPWTVTLGQESWTLADARSGLGRGVVVAQMAFDGSWETVSLPVTKSGSVASQVSFLLADAQRLDQAETSVEIADLKIVSDPAKAVRPKPVTDPYADLRGKTDLGADDLKRLTADLNGPDVVLAAQAAWFCAQVKVPTLVTTLIAQAEGADAAVVYASCRALKAQGTDEAFTGLKTVLDFGPFEINRRLAMEAIGDDVTKLTLKDIQSLVVSRSWMGRLAGLRAMVKIDMPNKAVQIITMLQDEDPRVRAAVVEAADADDELSAKRLLYGAVNDPSEEVRTKSFIKLIDSKVEAVRREAFASVRNESLAVALAVLDAMAGSPKPEYRPALLQAVVDPRPEIRSAAVEALKTQEKAITIPEVQNLMADPDPLVQLALAHAAAAGKLSLPADVLAKLKASPDYAVAHAARGVGG